MKCWRDWRGPPGPPAALADAPWKGRRHFVWSLLLEYTCVEGNGGSIGCVPQCGALVVVLARSNTQGGGALIADEREERRSRTRPETRAAPSINSSAPMQAFKGPPRSIWDRLWVHARGIRQLRMLSEPRGVPQCFQLSAFVQARRCCVGFQSLGSETASGYSIDIHISWVQMPHAKHVSSPPND